MILIAVTATAIGASAREISARKCSFASSRSRLPAARNAFPSRNMTISPAWFTERKLLSLTALWQQQKAQAVVAPAQLTLELG